MLVRTKGNARRSRRGAAAAAAATAEIVIFKIDMRLRTTRSPIHIFDSAFFASCVACNAQGNIQIQLGILKMHFTSLLLCAVPTLVC